MYKKLKEEITEADNYEMNEEITSGFTIKIESSDDDILQWESFNNHTKKSTQENDDYRYSSVQLTSNLINKKSDSSNVKQDDVKCVNKELKEEISETDNYEQNGLVELRQENKNIEQVFIKTENVEENYEMKSEITSELIIKEEIFDDNIVLCESQGEKKNLYGAAHQMNYNDSESTIDAHNQIKNVLDNRQLNSDEQFESNKCFETFQSEDKVEIYNPIQICQKKFEYSHSSHRHESTPTDKKPHKCDICKKTFSLKHNLKSHKLIHTGAKPYKCDICNKTFNENSNLTKHKSIHTDEKPFKCEVCKKTFRLKRHLTEHERIHTGEKPFACNLCNKTFNQNSALINHKRIHTGEKPYTCDVCKKTFRQKSHLNEHERIHTGEKPFACNVCNKTFSQNATLINHKRIHTGEKPLPCGICKTYRHKHL